MSFGTSPQLQYTGNRRQRKKNFLVPKLQFMLVNDRLHFPAHIWRHYEGIVLKFTGTVLKLKPPTL